MNIPIEPPFTTGSLDKQLVQRILTNNDIDEEEYIAFALSQDSEIGRFCRKNNYAAVDFLTGKVFDEAREHMQVSLSDKRHVQGKATIVGVKRDVRQMQSFLYLPVHIQSRTIAVERILPMMLDEIDQARDVRLLASLYGKEGKIVDKSEVYRGRPLRSEALIALLQGEEPTGDRSRIKPPRLNSPHDIAVSVQARLGKRVEKQSGDYGPLILFRLAPFLTDAELFRPKLRKTAKRFGVGKWLELVE